MTPDFWKARKVLLTGHTGFKGSWLSLWLQSLGVDVTGYSLDMPSKPCLFEAADVASGMKSIKGDVRDLEHLQSCFQEQSPEIVIHMAAQSLVRQSYLDPVETYSTNIMGTVNLFEAVRTCDSVRTVIIVTSDKCYENTGRDTGYRESDPMGGYDPYSSSKGCAELVTSAYRDSYFNAGELQRHGVAVASARAGNVIGGGDWAADRLIPDVVNAFNQGDVVQIRNPGAIRPWQFVLEPLNGYLLLAERLWTDGVTYSGGWNFGPNDEDMRSVSWVVESLAGYWDNAPGWECNTSEQPHEAAVLKLDNSKAKAELGWTPVQPLGLTLEWIAEWYRGYFNQGDVRKTTIDQIRRYQERLVS